MSEPRLRTVLGVLGLIQLAVGGWMMFATHSFGKTLAPFDGFNEHDLRDFATFYLALGLALLVAATRPGWRFPILVLATLEYGFHAINHAIDVNDSDPAWIGPRRTRRPRRHHRDLRLAHLDHRAAKPTTRATEYRLRCG
jgi:hypothetical protein